MKSIVYLFLFLSSPIFAIKNLPHGKVKEVSHHATYRVKVVKNNEDYRVKKVTQFPNKPGLWQFVNNFPDFTIQYVENFPDFTVKFVDNFPTEKKSCNQNHSKP